MSDNLKLWKSVEKTNPNYTKKANVKGNSITSIAPQYQVLNATEQFGAYGIKWGMKDIKYDYTLADSHGLVIFHAVFYFPDGEFEIGNSISLYLDNARTKVDDNFSKKVETDSLTKAISKLGFNADIFMGKFEDQIYLEEVKKKYAKPVELPPIDDVTYDKYIKWIAEGQKDKKGVVIDVEYLRGKHTLNAAQESALLLLNLETNG